MWISNRERVLSYTVKPRYLKLNKTAENIRDLGGFEGKILTELVVWTSKSLTIVRDTEV